MTPQVATGVRFEPGPASNGCQRFASLDTRWAFFSGIRVNKTVLPGGSGCVKFVALLSFLGSLGVNYLDAELFGALGTTDWICVE